MHASRKGRYVVLNSLTESTTIRYALWISDSSCPSRSASLKTAVSFHPSSFHDAAAAMIWLARSSVMPPSPPSPCCCQRCVVSENIWAQVRTRRQHDSASKPNSPDDSSERQLSVRDADVSKVRAAQ